MDEIRNGLLDRVGIVRRALDAEVLRYLDIFCPECAAFEVGLDR